MPVSVTRVSERETVCGAVVGAHGKVGGLPGLRGKPYIPFADVVADSIVSIRVPHQRTRVARSIIAALHLAYEWLLVCVRPYVALEVTATL